jgi:hypothetical protein
LIVSIVVLLLIVIWYWGYGAENFSEIYYLDQMAMKNSDPMYFKYSSWERDVDGMSPRDYYLENQANYTNQFAPGYFVGDQLYVDHTDYLNMPPKYRPKPPMQESGSIKVTKTPLDTKPVSAGAMQMKTTVAPVKSATIVKTAVKPAATTMTSTAAAGAMDYADTRGSFNGRMNFNNGYSGDIDRDVNSAYAWM